LRFISGMSLLETLIASAILATGLLSLAQLLGLATTATAAAGRTTHAALLASQKIEELRAFPEVPLEYNTDHPAPGYTREWSVAPLPSAPDRVAIIEVVVRVRGGDTRIVAAVPRTRP
jgi:Tfp pilus assembly protein PilV